jgi:hypothetical protein
MITIFLDIDGVLRTYSEEHKDDFKQGCIDRLNSLLSKLPNYAIVLSSAWRLIHGTPNTLAMLRGAGYNGKNFIGETPVLHSREVEIAAYMAAHGLKPHDVLILDDIPLKGMLATRQVVTAMAAGLTPKKLKKALALCGL